MASIRKKKGSKSYYACFRGADGLRHQVSTKLTNKDKAMLFAIKLERAAKNRDSRLALQKQFHAISEELYGEPLQTDTVRAYFARALEERKGEIKESTRERYQQVSAEFIAFLGLRADQPLRDCTLADIVGFRAEVAERTSAANANNVIKALRNFFTRAHQDGVTSENPTLRLRALREAEKDPEDERRPFTSEEMRLIREVAYKVSNEWGLMVQVAQYTGQRLADIANMLWGNINLENPDAPRWKFRTLKNGRQMALPLPKQLVELMRKTLAPSATTPTGPVFQTAIGHYLLANNKATTLSNQFNEILTKAGLRPKRTHKSLGIGRDRKRRSSPLTFHCYRHTVTSVLAAAGTPISVIQDFIGHELAETSRGYTHTDMKAKEIAAKVLEDVGNSAANAALAEFPPQPPTSGYGGVS